MSRKNALIGLLATLLGVMVAGIIELSAVVVGGSLNGGSGGSLATILPPSGGGSVVLDGRPSHAEPTTSPGPRTSSTLFAAAGAGQTSTPFGTAPRITAGHDLSPGAGRPGGEGGPGPGAGSTTSNPGPGDGPSPPSPPTISLALVNSLDAANQRMQLGQFGFSGTAVFALTSQDADLSSCSLSQSHPAVFAVHSSDNDVAHVVPRSISFTDCTDTATVSVVPEMQGSTLISLTVSSDSGVDLDAGPASFGVAIVSQPPPNIEPTVEVPADISVQSDGGAGQAVTFAAAASDPEDGSLTPVCTPASGSLFLDGETSVHCVTTDSGGLTYSASFKVHITPRPPPPPPPPPSQDALAPYSPTVTVATPDFVGDNGAWYRGPVTARVQDGGDRGSTDGSPVSGVDPHSYPHELVLTDTGSHTISGVTVSDFAGNDSNPAPDITVRVDADPPAVDLSCPGQPLTQGSDATASWTAQDSGSGLATPGVGTIPLDTDQTGSFVVRLPRGTERDHVGNESAQTTCEYVIEAPGPSPTEAPAAAGGTSASTHTRSPEAAPSQQNEPAPTPAPQDPVGPATQDTIETSATQDTIETSATQDTIETSATQDTIETSATDPAVSTSEQPAEPPDTGADGCTAGQCTDADIGLSSP